MSSLSLVQQKDNSIPWLFIAPTLLMAAHAMSGIALLVFWWRVGDLPINPVGLSIYLVTIATLGTIFLIGISWGKRGRSLKHMLLLLSLPAFTSLALSAALWLTRWLSNAPYAPWNVGDDDVVIYLSLFFVFSWIVLATLYGSYTYLLTGGIIQIAIYFAAHAFPHWARFPEASPLGVQSGFPILLIGLLVLGGFLVTLRKQVAPDFQPSLWVAVILLTAIGSWTLYIALSQFPESGMVLGWTETLTSPPRQVPTDAWNWTRSAAQSLILLAIVALPATGVVHWITAKEK